MYTVGTWPDREWHEAVKDGYPHAAQGMADYKRKAEEEEPPAASVTSVAVVKTSVRIEGKGEGVIQEYPGGRVWAALLKPEFRRLGGFGSRGEAEKVIREALS